MANPYKRPYFDSDVLIGWIKGEKISEPGPDGTTVVVERGRIAEHLLTLAEQRVFPVVISALTIAEVHKHKGKPKLTGDENQNVLDYFENDFVIVVPVDRMRGEEANKLCRQYEDKGLAPNDAIHLACAKKAGCDVLLSWEKVLNSISDPDIKIQKPAIWIPEKMSHLAQLNFDDVVKADSPKATVQDADKNESKDK